MRKKLLFVGIVIIILIMCIIILKMYLPQWKELPCGLWINKNGDIGLKTTADMGWKEVDFYITKTSFDECDVPLNMLVDTATFHYMGGSFYKDKNHIYNLMSTSDGGIFYPFDVDYLTFEILNGYYARDKNHVYKSNNACIVENADCATFQVIKDCVAQDKNGFFCFGDRIQESDVKKYLEISEK